MKKHLFTLIVVGIILIGMALTYLAFTVRWQEKALVLTFGKVSRVVETPGLNWNWPWQNVVKFDGRIRTYKPQGRQIQTRDKQTLIIENYVNWRINDVKVFYERFRRGQFSTEADVVVNAEKAIGDWLSESTNVLAEYNLGELITLDDDKFKLDVVEGTATDSSSGMLQRVQAKANADKGYGIEILDLGIAKMGVPDSVSKAVFARMNKDREAAARRLIAQGQSKADSIIGQAEGEADNIRTKAEAQAKRIEGEGDAEAAQHYAVFLDHPELANFLRRLETLRSTLSSRTTIILDSDSAPYNLLTTGPNVEE